MTEYRCGRDRPAAAHRPVYAETFYPRFHFGWSELLAATDARYRYVRAPRPELYDLSTDPGERSNRSGRSEMWPRPWTPGSRRSPDPGRPGARGGGSASPPERLAALGYVGLGAGRAQERINALATATRGSLPDPKDKIGVYESLRQALLAKGAGRFAEAVAGLQKIVATNPGLPEAWEALGETLLAARALPRRSGRSQSGRWPSTPSGSPR